MKVRRPHVDGVDQHLLQEANHRRVFDVGCDLGGLRCGDVFFSDVEIKLTAGQGFQHFAGSGALAFKLAHQLVVLDDHPLGRQLGGKLDALNGLLIGGVSGANEQAVTAFAQHHQLVLVGDLGVDQVARQLLQINRAQVQDRQCQRCGQGMGQVIGLDRTRTDNGGHKAGFALAGALGQFFSCFGRQLARVDQNARYARQG